MYKKFNYILVLLLGMVTSTAFAQIRTPQQDVPRYPGQPQRNEMRDTSTRKELTDQQLMDSLRKREEGKRDSVVITSKFIKVTNERLLNDSTQVFPIDTTLRNFENYSPLNQPRKPMIHLGNTGLPARNLLFEPDKGIGFDVGLHSLDPYLLNPQDVLYYRARAPYTNLYLVTSGTKEQVFKVIHTQNIKPNWNFGLNFNQWGSRGIYPRQNVQHTNAAIFSWYESKSKRYNILGNITFNNLRAPESGGIRNDTVFTKGSFDKSNEPVNLTASNMNWRNNSIYIKQFYYIGRIDTLQQQGGEAAKILPTQRVAYTLRYNTQKYKFSQDVADTYNVFPDYYFNSITSRDSLAISHIQNDFSYSFYLRGKSVSFVKNEVKLDLGLTHDLYNYGQYVLDSTLTEYGAINEMKRKRNATFQNITLKAKLGYRFSDRAGLDGDLRQVAQGYNAGDYLYDFKLSLSGGNRVGRIIIGAYSQNNTPPLVYTQWTSNHWIYDNSFNKQKTNSLSFNYLNDKLQIDLKAEYFLINNYLYFESQPNGIDAHPAQLGSAINLLKISAGKNFTWRRWHFDNYLVYQKTDFQSTLRTPEVYTYSNLYYAKLLFNVLNSVAGISVRYNTSYIAPSYAIGVSQFYNGPDVRFSSYPVASVYFKATLQKTNLFVMYDYANQGLFSKGYYTVNRYPMQDSMLKLGVSWNFYN
jgi:hypothetical protein